MLNHAGTRFMKIEPCKLELVLGLFERGIAKLNLGESDSLWFGLVATDWDSFGGKGALDHRRCVFFSQTTTEAFNVDCVVLTVKHGVNSVMVWGVISFSVFGPVVVLRGMITNDHY
ncbi:hypothetical protein TNCV_5040191 [Trichonephila clavipes]|nr:hypothetical protein TNCV_5040191 [Trichonephila clavipes]